MADWPPQIEVGTRVHMGVSSPDTGVVLKIQKNRRRARVRWDCNGVRWDLMANLFSVTRSLTEWCCYRAGGKPCTSCGYRADAGADVCHLCVPIASEPPKPGAAADDSKPRGMG